MRAQETAIFRLHTGHCGLSAHLRRTDIPHTSLCECGQADQTPDHVRLSCPQYAERCRQTWMHGADLATKLWGSTENLYRTQEDSCACYHAGVKVAGRSCYLTQSQYVDTGQTSPSADPVCPGTWQGSQWSANSLVTRMTRPGNRPMGRAGFESRSAIVEADAVQPGHGAVA